MSVVLFGTVSFNEAEVLIERRDYDVPVPALFAKPYYVSRCTITYILSTR